MSLSLIGNYSSDTDGSDSNPEEDESFLKTTTSAPPPPPSSEEKYAISSEEKLFQNYFDVGDDDHEGSDLSSDSDETESSSCRNIKKNPSPEETALPSAASALSRTVASSVFHSEYAKEEVASITVLEQHVKLTEAPAEVGEKNRRAPCRAFRKGNCRKGEKCRFSHILAGGLLSNRTHKSAPEDSKPVKQYSSAPVGYDARGEPRKKNKKRIGVTDSLLPPKKYKEIFDKQVAQETPWLAEKQK